jgi:hypothetical protein
MNRPLRRTVAPLVFGACLLSPCLSGRTAQALPATAAGANPAVSVLDSAAAWLWNALADLGIVRPQIGCSLDPNGCRSAATKSKGPVSPPATPDIGCSLDPSGNCVR